MTRKLTQLLQGHIRRCMWVILLFSLLGSACYPQPSTSASSNQVLSASSAPSNATQLENSTPTTPNAIPSQQQVEQTPEVHPTLTSISPEEVKVQSTRTSAHESQISTTPTQAFYQYYAQSGDTLPVVAKRFGVDVSEIDSPEALPVSGFLDPGQLLLLPDHLRKLEPGLPLIPDGEIVYGPSAADFDVSVYLSQARGYLSQHREYLRSTGWTSAADIITRVALENSINPRLLIALLEYSCGCVRSQSGGRLEDGYVLGVEDYLRKGLYGQLWWAANKLSTGYYGWRSGSNLEISLPDGKNYRPAPDSNAGSVALQYYFVQLWDAHTLSNQEDDFDYHDWTQALDPVNGLPALYQQMFGDAWARAEESGPLLPAGLEQPEMILPFEPGYVWSYASGPHPAWQSEGALAALDFAPSTYAPGCVESHAWVLAVADGPVVRSAHGAVIQDLDHNGSEPIISDMNESTGWAVFYMHIASEGRVPVGTYLRTGDPLGHPSCEGGPATGTHLHIARKYNGEWMAAGGPLPFVLDGWTAHAGEAPYKGTLTKGDQLVIAHTSGKRTTQLSRPEEED